MARIKRPIPKEREALFLTRLEELDLVVGHVFRGVLNPAVAGRP